MKVGLLSLGCPKNLVDSEVMLGLVQASGHQLTSVATEADVLVVNTCAFIDSAKRESIDAILEMARLKTEGACRRLIVTGCLAERYRDQLRSEMPEIDVVLGTGEITDIVQATNGASSPAPVSFFKSRQAASVTQALRPEPRKPSYIYDAETPRVLATPRHFAYVKVAEGCDYGCAFCIIPTLRGSYRSRPVESIVHEAETLASRGVKELLLVSQDTTFYGVDRSDRRALGRLLRRLNKISSLEWIRLLYLYPTTISDDALDAIAECDKVCKYVDLPLQHASNLLLRRMRRPGTRETYDRLLERIRDRVSGVALRTTFIVGFPGETAADVEELCAFVRSQMFDHVGVFTYSHEKGTPAFSLADDVPLPEKRARRARVMDLQRRLVRRRNRGRIGERVRVLVDGPSGDHELVWKGRLPSQAPDIDGVVYLTECDVEQLRPGRVIDAVIESSRGYDLVARPAVL